MPTTLQNRLGELALAFSESVLDAIRGASLEELFADSGSPRRAPTGRRAAREGLTPPPPFQAWGRPAAARAAAWRSPPASLGDRHRRHRGRHHRPPRGAPGRAPRRTDPREPRPHREGAPAPPEGGARLRQGQQERPEASHHLRPPRRGWSGQRGKGRQRRASAEGPPGAAPAPHAARAPRQAERGHAKRAPSAARGAAKPAEFPALARAARPW